MTSLWPRTEEREREPFFNMPPIVMWTAALLLLFYFTFALLPERLQLNLILDFAFIPARFGGLPPEYAALTNDSLAWAIFTMITHTGLHGGTFHAVFNAAWLVAFGTITARVVGGFGYVVIFVLGAVVGAALFWVVHPGDVVPVVGASGAISGLMGAASRFFFGPGPVPLTDPRLLAFAGAWMLINLIFGFSGFEVGGETGQIAWEAHMGGFFAGLLVVPFVARRR